jgi:hypothetical protein
MIDVYRYYSFLVVFKCSLLFSLNLVFNAATCRFQLQVCRGFVRQLAHQAFRRRTKLHLQVDPATCALCHPDIHEQPRDVSNGPTLRAVFWDPAFSSTYSTRPSPLHQNATATALTACLKKLKRPAKAR